MSLRRQCFLRLPKNGAIGVRARQNQPIRMTPAPAGRFGVVARELSPFAVGDAVDKLCGGWLSD